MFPSRKNPSLVMTLTQANLLKKVNHPINPCQQELGTDALDEERVFCREGIWLTLRDLSARFFQSGVSSIAGKLRS